MNLVSVLLTLIATIGFLFATDAENPALEIGEAKVLEISNRHNGKTTSITLRIDAGTVIHERIIMNPNNTVRGRVITTFRNTQPCMAMSYKGLTEPWFIEIWTWKDGIGHSVERRTFEGELIATQIFTTDDEGLVKTLDSKGNEMSDDDYQKAAKEVADILF